MAAASERVTREGFVSLACQGCGSALDKTANTVDKVCQTIYCNEMCLQKDAKEHALWCKKVTEEARSAERALTLINTKTSFQECINEGRHQERGFSLVGVIEGNSLLIKEPCKEEEGILFKPVVGDFPNLSQRIKHLAHRFPLPLHLIILSINEPKSASINNGPLHLLRFNNPMGKVEEKKGS